MVLTEEGYIIVNERDEILIGSGAYNRHDSWQIVIEGYKIFGFDKKKLQAKGFKCVRVSLRTEEYKR